MSSVPLTPIVSAVSLSTSFVDVYTVPSDTSSIGIDSVVFNNYSGNSATYTVRLIRGGVTSELTEIITEKNIRSKSNDLAPAMIGQALQTGGIIQVKASVDGAINLNITATVIKA